MSRKIRTNLTDLTIEGSLPKRSGCVTTTRSKGSTETRSSRNHEVRYCLASCHRLRTSSPAWSGRLSGTGKKNCTMMSTVKIVFTNWLQANSPSILVSIPVPTSNGVTVAVKIKASPHIISPVVSAGAQREVDAAIWQVHSPRPDRPQLHGCWPPMHAC